MGGGGGGVPGACPGAVRCGAVRVQVQVQVEGGRRQAKGGRQEEADYECLSGAAEGMRGCDSVTM